MLPEFAFAGRSNVGKSSLMNCLFGRKNVVKVSGRPGKTQGLNYFQIDGRVNMVDLPGYGFAKVSRSTQSGWQKLITSYLLERSTLCCVVVIMDLRHPPKSQDGQLLGWLRNEGISCLPVYTKADKLSGNERIRNAALLDAGHGIVSEERILFSAKNGIGLDKLRMTLEAFLPHESS
jgi:GTP-binding protein